MNIYSRFTLLALSAILLPFVISCSTLPTDDSYYRPPTLYNDPVSYDNWHKQTFNQTVYPSDFYGGHYDSGGYKRSSFGNHHTHRATPQQQYLQAGMEKQRLQAEYQQQVSLAQIAKQQQAVQVQAEQQRTQAEYQQQAALAQITQQQQAAQAQVEQQRMQAEYQQQVALAQIAQQQQAAQVQVEQQRMQAEYQQQVALAQIAQQQQAVQAQVEQQRMQAEYQQQAALAQIAQQQQAAQIEAQAAAIQKAEKDKKKAECEAAGGTDCDKQ